MSASFDDNSRAWSLLLWLVEGTSLASLSIPGWIGLSLCASLAYLYQRSTLSRRPRDMPCPQHGTVFRILYSLFSTRFAEALLAYMLHTKKTAEQAAQCSVAQIVPASTMGSSDLRVKIVPVLG